MVNFAANKPNNIHYNRMKRAGDYSHVMAERDKELFQVYKQIVGSKDIMSIDAYFVKIVNSPASRFFISMDRAYPVIQQMLNGNMTLCPRNATRKEMFFEILDRVKITMSLHPNLSLHDALAKVLRQPAPKFYITPGSAEVRICKFKKKWIPRHLRY